jgi:hypothetical protein
MDSAVGSFLRSYDTSKRTELSLTFVATARSRFPRALIASVYHVFGVGKADELVKKKRPEFVNSIKPKEFVVSRRNPRLEPDVSFSQNPAL